MNPFYNSTRAMAHYRYVNLDKYEKHTGKNLVCFLDDTKTNNHVATTRNTLAAILPEATIYTGSIGFSINGDNVVNCTINCTETGELMPFDDFITKYGVKLINNSKEGSYKGEITAKSAYMKEQIAKHNLIFTASAGNGYTVTSDFVGSAIVVSQASLIEGKPVYANDAVGKDNDFVMFPGFSNGTSFASPFLLGMIGKMLSVYGDISQDHAYRTLVNICRDLGIRGRDDKYGWGLPMLPKNQYILKDIIKANRG